MWGMLHEAADPSTELNRIMNSDYMEDFNAGESLAWTLRDFG